MNREQAAKLLPIIQALAEGKDIECRNTAFKSSWRDYRESHDSFEFPEYEWRIKPEVKERWMVIHKNGQTSLYEEKQVLANASWYIAQIKIAYTEGEGLA